MYDQENPYAGYDKESKLTPEQLLSLLHGAQTSIRSTISDVQRDADGIRERQSQITQDIDSITLNVSDITTTQDSINKKVGDLEVRADGIDATVSETNQTLSGTVERVGALEIRSDEIALTVSETADTVDGHSGSIASIELRADQIESEVFAYDAQGVRYSVIDQQADSITQRVTKDEFANTTSAMKEFYQGVPVGGRFEGEFRINKNYLNEVNNGEIMVDTFDGTRRKFFHPNGNVYTCNYPEEIQTQFEGAGGPEKMGFIIFYGSDRTRMDYAGIRSNDFLFAYFENDKWYADTNSAYVEFTPNTNDCIVAACGRKDKNNAGIDTFQMLSDVGAAERLSYAESSIKQQADQIQLRVTKTEYENLKINATNMLRGTDFPKTYGSNWSKATSNTRDPFLETITLASGEVIPFLGVGSITGAAKGATFGLIESFNNPYRMDLIAGKKYTVAFLAAVHANTEPNFSYTWIWNDSTSNQALTFADVSTYPLYGSTTSPYNMNIYEVKLTFTAAYTSKARILFGSKAKNDYTGTNSWAPMYIARPSIVEGDKAAGYAPAPEDFNVRITTAESSITQLADQIALRVTKTEYDSLQFDGTNILADSFSQRMGSNTVTTGTITRTPGEPTGRIRIDSTGSGSYFGILNLSGDRSAELVEGELYTLSFDVRGTVTNLNYTYLMRNDGSNASFPNLSVSLSTTEFKRVTFTMPAHGPSKEGYVLIGSRDVGSGKWYEIQKVQLQKASKATAWGPNPKEYVARISSAEAAITVNADEISSRVKTTDYNGNTVMSMINQTATTIKMQAERINMLGITNVAETLYIGDNFQDSTVKSIQFRGALGGVRIESPTIDNLRVGAGNSVEVFAGNSMLINAPKIQLSKGGITKDFLEVIDAQSYGLSATIGGGSGTMLYAGEGGPTIWKNNFSMTDEVAYIAADAHIKFFSYTNAGDLATAKQMVYENTGNLINYSGYMKADSFPTHSLEKYKENITPLELNALDIINKTDLFQYNLKNDLAKGITKLRYGLVIGRNTPEEVIEYDGEGVEQYAMNTLSWKAIKELLERDLYKEHRLALLEQKVDELQAMYAA